MTTSTARVAHPPVHRVALAVGFAAALTGALVTAGPGAAAFWLGLIGPDVALVAGLSRSFAEGRLLPRAVPAYNALHALPGPVATIAIGAGLSDPVIAGAGLAWLAHCLGDRAMGYGLRTRDGWQRG